MQNPVKPWSYNLWAYMVTSASKNYNMLSSSKKKEVHISDLTHTFDQIQKHVAKSMYGNAFYSLDFAIAIAPSTPTSGRSVATSGRTRSWLSFSLRCWRGGTSWRRWTGRSRSRRSRRGERWQGRRPPVFLPAPSRGQASLATTVE